MFKLYDPEELFGYQVNKIQEVNNMKLNYDLISKYERYNLTGNEEDEKIIINVHDVKTDTLKRKIELYKLRLMQLIKRYEKTDPDKITWSDRTLLEWGDSDKKKR